MNVLAYALNIYRAGKLAGGHKIPAHLATTYRYERQSDGTYKETEVTK